MEALVLREESFGEAVPAVAEFIHLIGAEGVSVGKRNELHAGWRVGVEAGQLSAGGGQGQRERLRAVTEEIAAGQDIVAS